MSLLRNDWQAIKQWRRNQRAELLARRVGVKPAQRMAWDARIQSRLHDMLMHSGASTISLYWPFKGEFNSRSLMQCLHEAGVCVALPVVEEPRAPLTFRRWYPEAPMTRGVYGIPIPNRTEVVWPDAMLAPLVGFDRAGYRLGYGGGYYDRTLAALEPTPFVVGVGYELSRLATIYPLPHDQAMNYLVTEAGSYAGRGTNPVIPTDSDNTTRELRS